MSSKILHAVFGKFPSLTTTNNTGTITTCSEASTKI
jgi:hypothetical protein